MRLNKDSARVEIIGDGGVKKVEIFKDYQWKKVVLESDELRGSGGVLTFQVSRIWNPKLAGISEDSPIWVLQLQC